MSNKEIVEQTKLAFEFIHKLNLEVSYLIKEIEGLLAEEEEGFIFGRPSAYGITTRSSTGLEISNIYLWTLRTISVFFIPEEDTKKKGGQTVTKFDDNLKVIYLRIILDEQRINEPVIYSGVLYDFIKKNPIDKFPTKFENIMGHIEYNLGKVFNTPGEINFEDANVKFKGKYYINKLFDINDSEDIVNNILNPTLELFRKVSSD